MTMPHLHASSDSTSTFQTSFAAPQAHAAAFAAIEHAQSLGVKVNVAVVDKCGILLAFLRMDDAFLHSIDIAMDKAYSAASFNLPTSAWPQLFEADPVLARALSQRPRMVPIGGGIPLRFAGVLAGGIGVSGASAEQDEACAVAGSAAIDADRCD